MRKFRVEFWFFVLVVVAGVLGFVSPSFADGLVNESPKSISTNMTTSLSINIDGHHDAPIRLKAVRMTVPVAAVNDFEVKLVRGSVESILVSKLATNFSTYTFYFDNDEVLMRGDILEVTLSNAVGSVGTFTYNYTK